MNWCVSNLRDGYVTIAHDVLRHGHPVAPRGVPTREVLGATIVLTDPTDALPYGVNRGINPKIAAAEAIQLIAGVAMPELLIRTGGNFNQFLEPDGTFWGSYGKRVGTQMLYTWAKLCADRDTRQAVITLWSPELDNVEGKHDYPCTLSLHFMIRNDRLDLHVTMRSNDVWWGLAYDAFQFTQLQLTLAYSLGIEAGLYFHHANSLHVYERDISDIEGLMRTTAPSGPTITGIGRDGQSLSGGMLRARRIMRGKPVTNPTNSEQWYIDKLASLQ